MEAGDCRQKIRKASISKGEGLVLLPIILVTMILD